MDVPVRVGTHPIRMLINATSRVKDPKVRSRWARALQYANSLDADFTELKRLFRDNGGIAGCARLAARSTKLSVNEARPSGSIWSRFFKSASMGDDSRT